MSRISADHCKSTISSRPVHIQSMRATVMRSALDQKDGNESLCHTYSPKFESKTKANLVKSSIGHS